jgi:hypothetical protein
MAQAPQFTSYEHEDAWDVNWLRVDDTHELYYQQFGKKDGKPGGNNTFPLQSFQNLTPYSHLPPRRAWWKLLQN